MSSKKLSRTTYRDPTLPGEPIRTGSVSYGEAARDMDNYYRALEQVVGSALHGWGVAEGLRVTATLNNPGITVQPGIALDASGRLISLAEGGNAEVGANPQGTQIGPGVVDMTRGTEDKLVGVAASGAQAPTAGLSGDQYVAIQVRESFDTGAYNSDGIYRYHHTPWIRLIDPNVFGADDGTRIVLARVRLDAAGNVIGLTHELRRSASLPAGVIKLRKSVTASPSPNFAVDNDVSGEIRWRAAGGIEVAVPGAADEIHLLGSDVNFAKLSVSAQQIIARRSDGKESMVIDTQLGNITAGTQGVEGDILVKDANNRLVITLDGEDAAIVVGAPGNEGDILVKDNVGQNAVRIDGATGDVWFRGLLQDPNGAHPGIGHDLLRHLRELTNSGPTGLHKHLNSLGNATRAISVPLFNNINLPSTIVTVSLPSRQRVFAFIAITSLIVRFIPPSAGMIPFTGSVVFADIDSVDGVRQPVITSGIALAAPFFVGQAQTITFRLASPDRIDAWAVGVVFPEG